MKLFLTLLSSAALGLMLADSASAQEMQCVAQTIETCPGACVDRCQDDNAFFDENAAACGRLIRDAQSDPAIRDTTSCGISGAIAGSEFGRCLRDTRNIKRNDTGMPEFEDFLAEAPTCSAAPSALSAMYACLEAETDTIGGFFAPLADRGYELSAGEPITADTSICTIAEDQITSDRLMAQSLTDQSNILSTEFSDVSSCRIEWEEFLNIASDNCGDGSCAVVIDAGIVTMRANIEPTKAKELEIQNIIDDIALRLEQINGAILGRTLFCPVVNR